MASINWLASYPKSGNTWMRVLLTNYLQDADTPADINRLHSGPIASTRVWFDEWVGVEASALDDAMIERLRPEVYRCLAREASEPLYMKVHDAWQIVPDGGPLFPAEITGGVIYILRNPLDLAASWAYHRGVSLDDAVNILCDPHYAMRQPAGGLTNQLRQFLGSWSSHVLSWIDQSGLPVLSVRYEDLLADTLAAFGGVVEFLGLPVEEGRLRKAVAFSQFHELQRQEQEKGFKERSVRSPGPFFRYGEAGRWRHELRPDMVSLLLKNHTHTMKRFGYLD